MFSIRCKSFRQALPKALAMFLCLVCLVFLLSACSGGESVSTSALPSETETESQTETAADPTEPSETPAPTETEEYDPFQDLTVRFSGFDTRGTLALEYTGPVEGLIFAAEKTAHLSNGEEILLSVSTPDGSDLREYDLKNGRIIKGSENRIPVEGLTELTEYDAFADVSVKLEGDAPEGLLHAVYNEAYPLRLVQAEFDHLSNGSAVTLELETLNDYDPAENGIRLKSSTQTVLIQGLNLRPASVQDLPQTVLKQLVKTVSRDAKERAEASWNDPTAFTPFQLEEALILQQDSSPKGVFLVLLGQIKGNEPFSYYSYALYEDVLLSPDGQLLSDPELYTYPTASVRFGHLHGEGFEKDGRYYAGFDSKESLLQALACHMQEGEELLSENGPLPLAAQPQTETKATLMTVGDMLLHEMLYAAALQPDGTYNYDFIFKDMGDYFKQFDLSIANNEVVIGGNDFGQRGYPCFNTRTEFGDAEIKAGINVVLHSNNHARDMNLAGIRHCLQYWKENHPEMTVLGIHESAEAAAQITVKEVNGIRIAMFNYTYGLNGLTIPDDQSYLVDRMDETTWDKIGKELRRAEEIADFTIVFPHWGTEYMLQPNYSQKSWAKWFIENGADLIIGNHSHCPQPAEWITASNGNEGLCYYSLGNFISNQSRTISAIGEIPIVEITKRGDDCYISSCDIDFEITYLTRTYTGHRAIPLSDFTEELARTHAASFDLLEDSSVNNNIMYPMNLNTLYTLTGGLRDHLLQQLNGGIRVQE